MSGTPSQGFEELIVWQKAHALVLKLYAASGSFPRTEIYGLTSQLRRAAVSVPANIAEGYKKLGLSDKLRFFNIAQGSLEEVRYYLILSRDLQYLDQPTLLTDLDEVARLLAGYMAAIRRRNG